MKTKFYIVRGALNSWYWHAKRGKCIVADSGECYKRRATMLKTLRALIASVRDGKFEIVDKDR